MSLYKQLTIFIVTLFLIMFCGTLWVNFNSTQNFLNNQLLSQTEDAVTSLGFSLSPYLLENDAASIQTTVNAVFDRGYYLEITVRDAEAQILVTREQPVTVKDVPAWFVDLVYLETPEVIREVSSGWAITGDIKVVGHAGYAYQQLWETINNSFIWFLSASLALILLGSGTLKALLKPLVAVTHQAEAICRRQYDLQIDLPRTTELRTVVSAMNRMTNKVKAMFDEQAKTATHLREVAYMDSLTGLGNQRYFKAQLNTYLTENDEFKMGVLFLIQICEFGNYNNRNGLQAGDDMLVAFSEIIKPHINGLGDTALSRITGGDFAMFIMEVDVEKAEKLASELMGDLTKLYSRKIFDESDVCHLGMVMLEENQTMGSVLSSADQALSSAKGKGENTWHRFEKNKLDSQKIAGRHDWLKHLKRVIHNKEVTLLSQSAVDSNHLAHSLHQEIFIQILDANGQTCPAGIFMTAVEQLSLSHEIDRLVINKIVEHLLSLPSSEEATFAINLSINSLSVEGFTKWILESLRKLSGDRSKTIIFEFSESVVLQNLDQLRDFSNSLQSLGHGLGLDQFGRGFSDFGYLKTLKPAYVKIDRTYTNEIEANPDNQFFVSTLGNICRSLEILVIAQAVENQSQWDTLKALNVDGVQGYFIGRPAKF